jgi:3-oxoacyl-[acyl-carrier protein] reductase
VFGSAISYAVYLVYSGEMVKRWAPAAGGLGHHVACVLCLLQFVLLRPLSAAVVAPEVLWLSVLNAVFCTAAPVLMVMMAIERIGSSLAAQTGMIGPMSTIVMGVWMLDEPFNPGSWPARCWWWPGAVVSRRTRLAQHSEPQGDNTWIWVLQGKWALVCGASKGLGLGCAQALAREGRERGDGGARAPRRWRRLRRCCAGQPRGAGAGRGGRHHHRRRPRRRCSRGRAGRARFRHRGHQRRRPAAGRLPRWDREAWIKAVDANMLTPIELIKATVDGMAARGFGRIVNITSSAVKAPIDILGLSNGARSGLTGFVAGVARSGMAAGRDHQQPAARQVRHRPPQSHAGGVRPEDRQVMDAVRRSAARPFRPAASAPREFGAICAFLCSVQAGYITGQNILPTAGCTRAPTDHLARPALLDGKRPAGGGRQGEQVDAARTAPAGGAGRRCGTAAAWSKRTEVQAPGPARAPTAPPA